MHRDDKEIKSFFNVFLRQKIFDNTNPYYKKIVKSPMKYYTFKAKWTNFGSEIESIIAPFWNNETLAILFNSSPDYEDVYIATNDNRIISDLKKSFELREIEPFNFSIKFMSDNSRTWGCKGNNFLFGF